VGNQYGKIFDALFFGQVDRHGVGWCSGFESHGEENNLSIRVLAGKFEGIEGRVDDANVSAA
jgi:hypothetical protein